MINDTLLIELITEELPPLSQKELGEHFGKNIYESLIHNQLTSASEYQTFSTPRRLGVKIFNVASEGLAEKKLIKLMPKKIGLDSEGNAQQALNKKLESIGEATGETASLAVPGVNVIENIAQVDPMGACLLTLLSKPRPSNIFDNSLRCSIPITQIEE